MATKYNKIQTKGQTIVHDSPGDAQTEQSKPKIVAKATKMKKPIFTRIGEALFGEGGIRNVFINIGRDVVLPAIQNTIVDGVTSGINMAVFGENKRSKGPYSGPYSGPVRYNDRFNSKATPVQNGNGYISNIKAANRVNDYIIEKYENTEEILSRLGDHSKEYGVVSIAEYYDMIGVETTYVDYEYGWTDEDIMKSTIRRVANGWFIDFPRVRGINVK